jgi:hypothetical protein
MGLAPARSRCALTRIFSIRSNFEPGLNPSARLAGAACAARETHENQTGSVKSAVYALNFQAIAKWRGR